MEDFLDLRTYSGLVPVQGYQRRACQVQNKIRSRNRIGVGLYNRVFPTMFDPSRSQNASSHQQDPKVSGSLRVIASEYLA